MAGFGAGPFAVFQTAWHHRSLILRLARREIDARYRGSVLGIVWAVLNPILMLAVYTFVFSVVFQARWGTASGAGGSNTEFALLLFSGLILFNVLGECLNRAPGLLLEIDQARFKEESADTVAGKPARKLVFERGVDSLSDHDRKYAKHFTSTLTVWIAPDGTPLAESRREDFSGRAFVVVSFEQHDGEERRFGLLGDRLVTLHDEEHALAQGAGEREESRTERQLQLQP